MNRDIYVVAIGDYPRFYSFLGDFDNAETAEEWRRQQFRSDSWRVVRLSVVDKGADSGN